jgi:hypothetical protein
MRISRVEGCMSCTSVVRSNSARCRDVARVLCATEARQAFYERVLDGIRKFLEDHAMEGKTGAREFYEFEKTVHERMLEAERVIVRHPTGHGQLRARTGLLK